MKDNHSIHDDGPDDRPHLIVIDDLRQTIDFESFLSSIRQQQTRMT